MKKLFLLLGCILMAATMSATTYKGVVYQGTTMRQYLETLPYNAETGEYDITVKVSDDKSSITLLAWTGNTGDDVTLTFDEDGIVNAVNGTSVPDASGYYSVWTSTGGLSEGGYYGIYVYGGVCGGTTEWAGKPNSYIKINEDGSGEGYFRVISYEVNASGANRHVYFKWGTEQVEEVKETTYNCLVSNFDGCFPNLNYNQNGEYLTTITVPSDLSYVVLNKFTGEENAENLKMYIDPDTYGVTKVNGLSDFFYTADLEALADSAYKYIVVYSGGYGDIEFSEEDGSAGEGYIYIYDYNTESTYTIDFSWPGELSPIEEDGIESVNANVNNNIVYNVAGQRVVNNFKGIAIKNGKKYFNK